jgi:cellulose synthase/poly-beta-1,6-N-acetylglucosamine synthase-like glycosyltransferase
MTTKNPLGVHAEGDPWFLWFFALFVWRYLRFVVNLAGFYLYKPSPILDKPTYTGGRDVTVIVPTVEPSGPDFLPCITSCARNRPKRIIIVAGGKALLKKTEEVVEPLKEKYRHVKFDVDFTPAANKRDQVARAVRLVDTPITVMLDDHVFWRPRFLPSVLAPFEDPKVGLVGTNKRVLRKGSPHLRNRIWNMLGALYLERHNFETRATNAIDGGVSVVSARTAAIRTKILQRPDFLPRYTKEMFLFNMFGPLNPDDDNYVTRFVVKHGWKIKIQQTPDSLVETTVGVAEPLEWKFIGQCLRWSRSTWRSNTCSLFADRTVWKSQPYCVYAVYIAGLTNFAAIIEFQGMWPMRTPEEQKEVCDV